MICTTLRFYGDLNPLLFKKPEGKTLHRNLSAPTSAKDLIEGAGIPHTEVDLILVNGKRTDFSYLPQDGDHFSIYPVFSTLTIPDEQRLQPAQLSKPRFLADVNLGKLARYLRIAGFDTAYSNAANDDELIEQMQNEHKTLLTRDRKLLMRKVVQFGYLPRSDDPVKQLEEVLRRFQLTERIKLFTRCPRCNGLLQSVAKEQIMDRLEPLTKKHYNHFSQCPDCGQVYWPGSHRNRLKEKFQKILKS
ncbi:MAG TPA: Mut7-C RNAse domain-containing protein [Balneolaceae bacterium]|nr:Mut7-C RNAse domain-containing protein [Balneolaceae bacterium]